MWGVTSWRTWGFHRGFPQSCAKWTRACSDPSRWVWRASSAAGRPSLGERAPAAIRRRAMPELVESVSLAVSRPRPGVVLVRNAAEPLGVLRLGVKRALLEALKHAEAEPE